jgi:hypothetical protein
VRDAVAGKTALYLRHCYWDHLKDGNVDMVPYTKKVVDFFGRRGLFIETAKRTELEAVEFGQALHELLKK